MSKTTQGLRHSVPVPRALLIVNPFSRSGRTVHNGLARAAATLQSLGYATSTTLTRGPGDAHRAAAAATEELLMAVGGDGTVQEIASGILYRPPGVRTTPRRPILGIVPTGTGNDVARLLGVGTVDLALQALHTRHLVSWDAIQIQSRVHGVAQTCHALLFAGAGFVGDVLQKTSPGMKRWLGGSAPYAIGFFRAVCSHRPPTLTIQGPGFHHHGPTLTALAANAPVAGGGGMRLGPGARVDDGSFDASVIQGVGRFAVARHFLRLTRGTHIHHPAVRYFRAARLEISGPDPVRVVADGEIVGQTPALFQICPLALQLVSGAGMTTDFPAFKPARNSQFLPPESSPRLPAA